MCIVVKLISLNLLIIKKKKKKIIFYENVKFLGRKTKKKKKIHFCL